MNTKIIFGSLVLVGLAVGGYLYIRNKKKSVSESPISGEGVGEDTTKPKAEGSAEGTQSVSTSNTPQTKTSCSETKNLAGDKTWDYRKCDGVWFTRRKGTTGSWVSLAGNNQAISKLDAAFPKL